MDHAPQIFYGRWRGRTVSWPSLLDADRWKLRVKSSAQMENGSREPNLQGLVRFSAPEGQSKWSKNGKYCTKIFSLHNTNNDSEVDDIFGESIFIFLSHW
jgi:hypothetical protein